MGAIKTVDFVHWLHVKYDRIRRVVILILLAHTESNTAQQMFWENRIYSSAEMRCKKSDENCSVRYEGPF